VQKRWLSGSHLGRCILRRHSLSFLGKKCSCFSFSAMSCRPDGVKLSNKRCADGVRSQIGERGQFYSAITYKSRNCTAEPL
jgi:hypothetical protein